MIDTLICLNVVVILLCKCISKHHVVYLKYIQFLKCLGGWKNRIYIDTFWWFLNFPNPLFNCLQKPIIYPLNCGFSGSLDLPEFKKGHHFDAPSWLWGAYCNTTMTATSARRASWGCSLLLETQLRERPGEILLVYVELLCWFSNSQLPQLCTL